MTRILHMADTHLGYRQYKSSKRAQDYMAAFTSAIDIALEEGVDAVVHGGDLFDRSTPDVSTIRGTIQQLRRLRDANIPFLTVVGNHDATHTDQWSDVLSELDLATRLSAEPTVIGNTAFYGIDYADASTGELPTRFRPASDVQHQAVVAHESFRELTDIGTSEIVPLLEDAGVALDLALLGDYHEPVNKEVTTADFSTCCFYPGATERTAKDQIGTGEVNLFTISDSDGTYEPTRIELDTRTFVTEELALDADSTQEDVQNFIDTTEINDTVFILQLTGEGEPFMTGKLEEYARESGALISRIVDERTADEQTFEGATIHDPDEFIDERISETPLTQMGERVDKLTRREGIANSNITERAETIAEEFLDEDISALADRPTIQETASEEASGDSESETANREGGTANQTTTDEKSQSEQDSNPDEKEGEEEGSEEVQQETPSTEPSAGRSVNTDSESTDNSESETADTDDSRGSAETTLGDF